MVKFRNFITAIRNAMAVFFVDDEWVLVPREPTLEMYAAMHAYDGTQYSDPSDFDDFVKDYRDMINAVNKKM